MYSCRELLSNSIVMKDDIDPASEKDPPYFVEVSSVHHMMIKEPWNKQAFDDKERCMTCVDCRDIT